MEKNGESDGGSGEEGREQGKWRKTKKRKGREQGSPPSQILNP